MRFYKRFQTYCLPFVLLWNALLPAQTMEDFSDGNITQNPVWAGDISHFIVNHQKVLQLNAPAAGASTLYVPLTFPDSAVWRLDVRLGFAPSSTNRLRIYLMADSSDLASTNGYFLEIGENGSNDALRFYRQDAGSAVWLGTGTPGLVADDTLAFQITARRNGAGWWTVGLAFDGGAVHDQEIAVYDAVHTPEDQRYFGLMCTYSATRVDKFYFDNLHIEEDLPDVSPPVAQSVTVNGDRTLMVVFDEGLDSLQAVERHRYFLEPLAANPDSVVLEYGKRSVRLIFPAPLATGDYSLVCDSIADVSGNLSGEQILAFYHVRIQKPVVYDVLINEIMADPTPSAGLPEVEWLELYNRSSKYIALDELRLGDLSEAVPLPAGLLGPGEHAVLASPAHSAALQGAGIAAYSVEGMPALNNTSDAVVLSTADGILVDRVTYSVSWHDDEAKEDGGWSLERMDPLSPCMGPSGWRSCPLPIGGGTPGLPNAAYAGGSDTFPPLFRNVHLVAPDTINLTFSEGVSGTLPSGGLTLLPEVPFVANATGDPSVWTIALQHALQGGVLYSLVVGPGWSDCAGNRSSAADTVTLGLPEAPEPGDVVLSELLFNPPPGGSDFVELHNRSSKILSMDGFFLDNPNDNAPAAPVSGGLLVFPGDYVVLTPDTAFVTHHYQNVAPERLVTMSLPSMPDDTGTLILLWSDGLENLVMESVSYSEDNHSALLRAAEREGVSLERLSMDHPADEPVNWTSAAQQLSGLPGTPTQPNSQALHPGAASHQVLFLPVNRLSPDGDGREDFLEMHYRMPASGYAASLTVYDSGGLPVKRLLRHSLAGVEGFVRWDGDDDAGAIVRPGIYVLYFEFFSPENTVQRLRKSVAVVGTF